MDVTFSFEKINLYLFIPEFVLSAINAGRSTEGE